MKKNYKDIFVICFMLWLLMMILFQKRLIFNTISYSLNLWVKNLLPTMFPFFIISDILISYNVINYVPSFIKKFFCYIFNVSDQCIAVFFLSSISGFPNNARITKIMYEDGAINRDEATRILMFTHFSNPIFILSTVGVLFLHNEKFGYLILLSHVMGNVIIGILTRNMFHNRHIDYTEKLKKSQSFSLIFIQAIKRAIDTLLLILGTLTCFLIFASLLIHLFNFSYYTGTIFKGVLEITMGLKSLSSLTIPAIYKVVISSAFLSFGGLAVHMQVLSQIADTDISYFPFFVSRIIHAIVSGFICFIFCLFF